MQRNVLALSPLPPSPQRIQHPLRVGPSPSAFEIWLPCFIFRSHILPVGCMTMTPSHLLDFYKSLFTYLTSTFFLFCSGNFFNTVLFIGPAYLVKFKLKCILEYISYLHFINTPPHYIFVCQTLSIIKTLFIFGNGESQEQPLLIFIDVP